MGKDFNPVCFPSTGNERELLCVDIKQLEACTKQSREVPLAPLTFQHVENIINCHLFALKKVREKKYCAFLAIIHTPNVYKLETS